MSAAPYLGIDIGELTVKVATDGGVETIPASAGGPVAAIRVALARAGTSAGICIAVPDAWLSGEVSGAARQEELRHACEAGARTGPVGWAGQLAAVSAFAAMSHGQGRYLVCEIGGTGVRAGVFSVSGGTVRIGTTYAEAGGGWRDFDAAIRASLPPGSSSGWPAAWYEQAMTKEKRARAVLVLEEAATGLDDALDTRLYRIAGADGDIPLTARAVIDSFAPTRRRHPARPRGARREPRLAPAGDLDRRPGRWPRPGGYRGCGRGAHRPRPRHRRSRRAAVRPGRGSPRAARGARAGGRARPPHPGRSA